MILNLTQHRATPEQKSQGVVDLPEKERAKLQEALTFLTLPSREELEARADWIASMAQSSPEHPDAVMIGGAPYFMSTLETVLQAYGFQPLYAFSRREVTEVQQEDGSTLKKAVFRHLGFVEAS